MENTCRQIPLLRPESSDSCCCQGRRFWGWFRGVDFLFPSETLELTLGVIFQLTYPNSCSFVLWFRAIKLINLLRCYWWAPGSIGGAPMVRPFQCYSWWGETALSAFWEGACDLQTQRRERTGMLWCPVLQVAPASSACGRCSSVPSACCRLAEQLGFSPYSVAFPSSLASFQWFYDEAWCR